MITSLAKELFKVSIPFFDGEIKMLPFSLNNIDVPVKFKQLVSTMLSCLPIKTGTAYLTVDGKIVKHGETQRRGGKHIDGNYLPEICNWGNGGGGGNGWKVGEGGRILSSLEHKKSYQTATGGMLIASTYPACKGWVGQFNGDAYVGGDCSRIECNNEGFILKENTLYYGNSQFLHESIPIDKTVHRTLVRITLPKDYPVFY